MAREVMHHGSIFIVMSSVVCKSCSIKSVASVLIKTRWIQPNHSSLLALQLRFSSHGTPMSENDEFNDHIVNRNPRNLEKLCRAFKPRGWNLEYPPREYWHKVFLDRNVRHTVGRVDHFTGKTVVVASTQELAIRKFLYRTTDVSAAENIGRILARRCLESGIQYVHCNLQREETSEKVKVFLEALTEGGLILEEPDRIYPDKPWGYSGEEVPYGWRPFGKRDERAPPRTDPKIPSVTGLV